MKLLPTHTPALNALRRGPRYGAALLALCCAAMALPAAAQWGWREKNGQRVFSDQQPPTNIAEKDIFKRPAGSPQAVAKTAPADASNSGTPGTDASAPDDAKAGLPAAKPANGASAAKASGTETELEKKKKQAQAAEAAKKKAAEAEQAKVRADNCDRATRALTDFRSGVRIAQINAKGEREIMNEAQRATETARLQDLIGKNCKG